jgi:hypothetical protein
MPGKKLDGAGTAKLKTLEEALGQLQTVHGKVETFAMELKRGGNAGVLVMQLRRLVPMLVGLLKPQFGMIADQAAALNLVIGRGGSDQTRLRALREGVATLRTALELTAKRVEEQHTVVEEEAGERPPS